MTLVCSLAAHSDKLCLHPKRLMLTVLKNRCFSSQKKELLRQVLRQYFDI
jgi:hypothetical protein